MEEISALGVPVPLKSKVYISQTNNGPKQTNKKPMTFFFFLSKDALSSMRSVPEQMVIVCQSEENSLPKIEPFLS